MSVGRGDDRPGSGEDSAGASARLAWGRQPRDRSHGAPRTPGLWGFRCLRLARPLPLLPLLWALSPGSSRPRPREPQCQGSPFCWILSKTLAAAAPQSCSLWGLCSGTSPCAFTCPRRCVRGPRCCRIPSQPTRVGVARRPSARGQVTARITVPFLCPAAAGGKPTVVWGGGEGSRTQGLGELGRVAGLKGEGRPGRGERGGHQGFGGRRAEGRSWELG